MIDPQVGHVSQEMSPWNLEKGRELTLESGTQVSSEPCF